jgi:AcrR family transcriptional regulator
MTTAEAKRGRPHDAAGAQEAILNAAEAAFAEQGFAGARIDAIAKAAGYNSSLIFHYFGDKLGLYTEVVRRADQALSALQGRVLAPLLGDESIAENADALRALLENLVTAYFDYVAAHPRFMRTLLWEQAGGWQTYARIVAQLRLEEAERFQALFAKAHEAGLLRSTFAPMIQVSLILQICLAYLSFIPIYQMAFRPNEDLASATALARAREYITTLVVNGMMNEPTDKQISEPQ